MWRTLKRAVAEEFGSAAIFDRLYEHRFVDAFKGVPVVVDLGANQGHFARAVLERYPGARVILVEANPLLAEALERRYDGRANVQVIAAAVGGHSRPGVEFHLSDDDRASSIYRPLSEVHGLRRGSSPVVVEMVTVAGVIRRSGLTHIDLLKMDVEGAEIEIVESLGDELEMIDQLSIEFHDFVDPSLRASVLGSVAKLERAGYALFAEPTDYLHGSAFYGCLFYRRTTSVAARIRARAFSNAWHAPFRLARRLGRRVRRTPGRAPA